MADITDTVTSAPSAVFSFAKSRTFAFVVLAVALVVVAVRFRAEIANGVSKVPVLGPLLLKAMGVGAALLAFFAPSVAHAATTAATTFDLGDGGMFGIALGALGALGAMLLGAERSEDLVSDAGGKSLTTTASASFPLNYRPQNVTHGGYWKIVTGVTVDRQIQIDQPAAGGSVINADQLSRTIGSLQVEAPLFGRFLNADDAPGAVLKNLIEFVSNGYRATGAARAQIPAADGDTACRFLVKYSFCPQWGVRAQQDFGIWAGWLGDMKATFVEPAWAAGSSPLEAVSTGVALEATAAIAGWANYIYSKRASVPVFQSWRRFTTAAGSGVNQLLARDWLEPSAIKAPLWAFARVAGVYELTDIGGMGGPDGVDNITRTNCAALGIDDLENTQSLMAAYLDIIGPRGPKSGIGASTPLADGAGNPYSMGATINGSMADDDALYLPLHTPTREQELVRLPLMHKGTPKDLIVQHSFTSTPSSGTHVVMVNTVQKFAPEFEASLAQRAGMKLGPTPLADGSTMEQLAARGYDPGEMAILPTEMVPAG